MARLPDLQVFAAEHGLKIGTIADLIQYRSRTESLLERVGTRACKRTVACLPPMHLWTSLASRCTGLWCVATGRKRRRWLCAVHQPLSVLDALEVRRSMHSWSLDESLSYFDKPAVAWPCS